MLKVKNNFKETLLKVRIFGYEIESAINEALSSGIKIHSLKMKSKSCAVLIIKESDKAELLRCCKNHRCKMEIYYRQGIGKVIKVYKQRITFALASVFFVVTLMILNRMLWEIDIETGEFVSPLEVREILSKENIKPGIFKNQVDKDYIEKKLMEKNSIAWADIQIVGGKLIVRVKEKNDILLSDEKPEPSSLVASKDGVVTRVHAGEGEVLVKPGDIIKKGDFLIGGIQGKEGKEYLVQSEGKVFAKTFYERHEIIKKSREVMYRTGRKSIQVYFLVKNKKIYLINNLNKFENYDKIIDNKGPLNIVTFYEVEKKQEKLENPKQFIKEVQNGMKADMEKYLFRDCKVLDKIEKVEEKEREYYVSLILIVEEDIAVSKKMKEPDIGEIMKIIKEKRRIEFEEWLKHNL